MPAFAKGEPDPNVLLQRLNEYGREYFQLNKQSAPVILIGISIEKWESIEIEQYEFIRIHRISNLTNNFLYFSYKSFLFFRTSGIRPRILISGDIYFGFLSTFLIKKLWLRINVPVQISVHGYYLETRGLSKLIPSFLFRLYILKIYNWVDSIRVVSNQLKLNLITMHGVTPSKIFVAPIPIRLHEVQVVVNRKIDLLFVGRFHAERGIDLLTKICKNLQSDSVVSNIVLVGDGPLKLVTQQNLGYSSYLTFKGYVSPHVLTNLMLDAKIVLSTAPLEGFGLAIREALASGCFVVARRNEVTADLNADFPSLIYLFDTEHEAFEIISSLLSVSVDFSETHRFRAQIEASNTSSLESLIGSWEIP
jgi:glycosyltransferase involved in cell wall biosynthesis